MSLKGFKVVSVHHDLPDNLDAFLDMTAEDISRLVLCLLIEEALQKRLASFRQPGAREWSEEVATLLSTPDSAISISPRPSP